MLEGIIVERSEQRDLQHLGLPTACAVIYSKVTGVTPDPREPQGMREILNDVAHALSNLVPIFAPDRSSGLPILLPALELIEGKFSRGAHAFCTKKGTELRNLTIQRRDMLSAIVILKAANIRFQKPGEPKQSRIRRRLCRWKAA